MLELSVGGARPNDIIRLTELDMKAWIARHEVKLDCSDAEFFLLIQALGAKKSFPDRLVQSTYLDSSDLFLFHESEEGLLPRLKVRTRWYDGEKRRRSLEVKVSEPYLRRKFVRPLDADPDAPIIAQLGGRELLERITVEYRRSYFEAASWRFTRDTEIVARPVDSQREVRLPEAIHELKVELRGRPRQIDGGVDNPFGLSSRRFSKYCLAVSALSLS